MSDCCRRCFHTVSLALILALIVPGHAAAQGSSTKSVADLIEAAEVLDGSTVIIEGEAIGRAMVRGEMAWVNVADSSGAIGLWMSADSARSIRTYGSYRFVGDQMRVSGVFHKACAEHGGDTDIHVDELLVVVHGRLVRHPLDMRRVGAAVMLGLAALAALAALGIRDRRQREREAERFGRPNDGGD